jgi:hypothetical protein
MKYIVYRIILCITLHRRVQTTPENEGNMPIAYKLDIQYCSHVEHGRVCNRIATYRILSEALGAWFVCGRHIPAGCTFPQNEPEVELPLLPQWQSLETAVPVAEGKRITQELRNSKDVLPDNGLEEWLTPAKRRSKKEIASLLDMLIHDVHLIFESSNFQGYRDSLVHRDSKIVVYTGVQDKTKYQFIPVQVKLRLAGKYTGRKSWVLSLFDEQGKRITSVTEEQYEIIKSVLRECTDTKGKRPSGSWVMVVHI